MRIRVLDRALYSEELASGFVEKRLGDAGIDLRARHDAVIPETKAMSIPLGVSVAVPRGCVGWLTGRSTTALGMNLIVHEGKIDAGYRGEIHALVSGLSCPGKIERGDRICQLVVVRIEPPVWVESDLDNEEWTDTERGEDGLGSTGRR